MDEFFDMVHGDLEEHPAVLGMTEDEKLVVLCPVDECPWATLLDTSWSPLPDVTYVYEPLKAHLTTWHEGEHIELQDDLIIDTNRNVGGAVALMKAKMAALRRNSCVQFQLWVGNLESDGVARYAMKQMAKPDDGEWSFDDWWRSIEEHAMSHRKRASGFVGMLSGVNPFSKDVWAKLGELLDGLPDKKDGEEPPEARS